MVLSMTGYGRAQVSSNQLDVTVEMKSVNHRFSEIQIRMPRQLLKLEEKMKKILSRFIHRGRVEVFVTIEGEGLIHRSLHIDWELLDDYYQLVNRITERYNLPKDVTLQDLLMRDELISIEEREEANEEVEQLVLAAVEEAGKQLLDMRQKEGEELHKDLEHHLQKLCTTVESLKELAPSVVKAYKERLEKKMKEFASGVFDEARLLTEVAVFSDKADINEEITRLLSHIQQFQHTLQLQEPVGRKLDFLIQEMNREVNTIGSKANDSHIASKVVEMKTFLEKMREQVQNIE
jgi:uncharacterized protein (TIGR00255 family)